MTKFECFKSKNIDELTEWLDKYENNDSPWNLWFDENYCNKCESVIIPNGRFISCEYAWCEIHNKCRYFQDMNDIPSHKQTIKMWLESEE